MKMGKLGTSLVLAVGFIALGRSTATAQTVQWLSHLDFISGDTSVTQTSFSSTQDFGLTIRSTTLGSVDSNGGLKLVSKGVEAPQFSTIIGVRVCYSLTNPRSFISQVRLEQVQDPPISSAIVFDDATPLNSPTATCVNSQPTSVDPSQGAVILDLRLNFGDTSDRITIKAIGIITQ